MEYAAMFEPAEEGGFIVTFPDFDWGITQGDTEEEARQMAADALATMIHEHIRKGENLPRPSRPRGRKYRTIRLSALQGFKAELYVAFRASGITKAELARRIGLPKTVIDRLFDFGTSTRLNQIEAAFAALGKQIDLNVRDAA
jgi:antitoxin HicB